jgi:hypothetical protein
MHKSSQKVRTAAPGHRQSARQKYTGLLATLRNDVFVYSDGPDIYHRKVMLQTLDHTERLVFNPEDEVSAEVLLSDSGWDSLRHVFEISTYHRFADDLMPDAAHCAAMFGLLQHVLSLTAKFVRP